MRQTLLEFYHNFSKKKHAYQFTLNTLHFDVMTNAPKLGIPYRNHIISILYGEYFTLVANLETIKKLEEILSLQDIDQELRKEIELQLRELDEMRYLPKKVYVEFTKILFDSEIAWAEAKTKDEYQIFMPHLHRVIEKQKEVLTHINKQKSGYDYLLDRYQKGTSIESYDAFFNEIKEALLPMIKQIQAKAAPIDNSPLYQFFDIKKQEQFIHEVVKYLQINKQECFIGFSSHPCTASFSSHESRITIHYQENNLMAAIFSLVHEYGHALYGLQVKEAYEGSPLATCIGYALHESQARLLENHIVRSRAFWEVHYPKLQAIFSKELATYSLDTFLRMIHAVKPSFIRMEADELTYPIHILIRYELEKAIMNGNISAFQLHSSWNDKYEKYLGIRPIHDKDGILQDFHWSSANFGYFPTYALGSAIAAQIYHQMEKELPVDKVLRNGEFHILAKWLKNAIHTYGATKEVNEILVNLTREPFHATYYIKYLKDKYTALYHL